MASFHSRDMQIAVEGAFDAEARLLALSGDVLVNVRAYAPYPNTAGVEPLRSPRDLKRGPAAWSSAISGWCSRAGWNS